MPEAPLVAEAKIRVAGSNLSQEISAQIIRIEVETSLDVPNMATIMLNDDANLTLIGGTTFKLGDALEISFVDFAGTFNRSSTSSTVFVGEITAIEPHFGDRHVTLLVRGYDKRHRLNRQNIPRTFTQVKDSDIISQLASASGLSATVDATPVQHEYIVQPHVTDLEYINMLAARNSLIVWMDEQALKVTAPPTISEVTLEWAVNLMEFHPRLSAAGQVNEVTVRGWDSKEQQEIVGTATTSSSHPNIGFGKSGGQAAQSAFSAAKSIEVYRPVANQDEATRLAKAILDDINGQFIEADGICAGNATILAGKMVEIKEVGSRFNGKYMITAATHVMDGENGYIVYFRTEGLQRKLLSDLLASPNGQTNRLPGMVPAKVTNIKDPEDAGRVRVKYAWKTTEGVDVESWWAPVVSAGAGNERGFFVLPEVNDEVLIAFEHGDINRPYVLGGIWSSRNKPPLPTSQAVGSDNTVAQRMFKTTMGHTMVFMDKGDAKSITIHDSDNKHTIVMDGTNNKIQTDSQGDIQTKVQGKHEVESTGDYQAKSSGNLKLEASANIEAKASANMNLKSSGGTTMESTATVTIKGSSITITGNANISIESSGMLTLKGSMVKIN
jgi:phage protein D